MCLRITLNSIHSRAVALPNLISASFSCRVIALIAASCFDAKLREEKGAWYSSRAGSRLRVYLEAVPSLCCSMRRVTFVVMPV